MAIEYLVTYGLYFANSADGIAAKAVNGGSIILPENLTPDAAAALYPAGIVVQSGPWVIQGLTGTPGVPTGAYADFQQGLGTTGVAYAPTSHILTADSETTATETVVASGQTYDLVAHWNGTLIFDAGSGGGTPLPPEGPARPVTGRFRIQTIKYTGDGTDGRLLPTAFALNEAG